MGMRNENLLWMDLETTGSELADNSIIEVGWAITDAEFNIKAEGSHIVETFLWPKTMDWAVIEMHTKNGLLHKLVHNTDTESLIWIEQSMIRCLESYATKGKIRLAGSGVAHFDMKFIQRDMPELMKRLYYAPFDIGHVRRAFALADKCHVWEYEDKNHRAFDDVVGHIKEAKAYIDYLKEAVR